MGKRRRLFATELPADGGAVMLPLESLEHVHVLRLEPGAEVELFDGQGGVADATIARVSKREVECLAAPRQLAPLRRGGLQLVVCLPKAGKLETIVRMTTELGVAGIHLASSERSVPKLGADSAKIGRLRRVAREACAQSGNARAPELSGPRPLLEAAAAAPSGALKLAFWEAASQPLPAAYGGGYDAEIWAVVGPEGGLSEAEATALASHGYAPISLGSHILRAETACVVIAALLLDRSGALSG
jgi:16S rRNA (uracil1498-N3)-methyltransferase